LTGIRILNNQHVVVGAADDDAVAGLDAGRALAVADECGARVDAFGGDDDGAAASEDDGGETRANAGRWA